MEETINSFLTPQSDATYFSGISWNNDLNGEATLNDLYTNTCALKEPMSINLQYRSEDRCFVAIQNDLSLWGEDTTLQGAEKELAAEITKLYKRLSELETNRLGPYPLKLLSFLKQHIS